MFPFYCAMKGERMRVALHTRLRPGKEAEYERVHAVIPRDLEIALRDAGVSSWAIYRDGLDLFHVLEVCEHNSKVRPTSAANASHLDEVRPVGLFRIVLADYQAMRHALRDHPANVPWQRRMAELLDVEDDYSGTDSGLKLVWELS